MGIGALAHVCGSSSFSTNAIPAGDLIIDAAAAWYTLKPMLISKCDVCKKTIPNRESSIEARVGYKSFEFCKTHGARIGRVLNNYKLIK